ncbi:MAG: ABC transporter substrate-binding protein [Pseudonocardia sp.]
MSRSTTAAVATVAVAVLVAGCSAGGGAQGGAAGFPVTVENCGRQVTIDRPPERVLTIGPESLTMVEAAGGLDKVVATQGGLPSGAEAQFAGVRQLPVDDPPGTETIIAERPDLVVSYGLSNTDPETLGTAGISSLVLTGMCGTHDDGTNVDGDVDFDDVYGDLQLYGRLFGTTDQADKFVADLSSRVQAVQQAAAANPPRSAAVIWPGDGGLPYGYGTASMTQTMLATLGMRNVFDDVSGFGREISKEELIDRNPDVIILYLFGDDNARAIENLRLIPGIGEVTALKRNQVMALQSTYLRPSAGVVDGLEIIARDLAAYR